MVARVDESLGEYYRALVPKYLVCNSQMEPSHVTVVRSGIESPDFRNWLYRDGEVVTLWYSPELQFRYPYWWLDVWSPEVGEVRRKLGLGEYRIGWDRYHLTVGNCK